MAVKSKSRKRKDRRKHMGTLGILVVLVVVLSVAAIAGYQQKLKNQVYAEREADLESEIADEEERSKEIEDLEAYTKTKKYVEDVAKDKLGLVYEDEVIFKAEND